MPKTSELTAADTLGGTEVVALVQAGDLKRSTATAIANTASIIAATSLDATSTLSISGAATLRGGVTVSGGATISAGTLTANGASALAGGASVSGGLTVSGGTLTAGACALSGAVTISGSGLFTTTGDCILGTQTTHSIAFYGTSGAAQRASAYQVTLSYSATVAGFGFSTSAQASAFIELVNEMQRVLLAVGLLKGGA